jgi:TPR repeat protein
MEAVHAAGVVHRDLSPNNVLLDEHFNAKIADFGMSKLLSAFGPVDPSIWAGTNYFRAPEVHRGEDYDQPVDVFAFAMVLFVLFTGRTPYAGMKAGDYRKLIIGQQERESLDGVPAVFQGLIRSCWVDGPLQRPTFGAIVTGMECPEFLEGIGVDRAEFEAFRACHPRAESARSEEIRRSVNKANPELIESYADIVADSKVRFEALRRGNLLGGSLRGQLNLALAMVYDQGCTGQVMEGFKLLTNLAQGGEFAADANYEIGKMYQQGMGGVAKSPHQAADAFEKAADMEHAEAQAALGRYFVTGYGRPLNLPRAVALFEKAANGGSPLGMVAFAEALLRGACVLPDRPRARRLLETAASKGVDEAYFFLWATAEDERRASEAARAGAERGVVGCELVWADAIGGEKGEWLRAHALAKGRQEEQIRFGLLFEEGKICPLNLERAMELYGAAEATFYLARLTARRDRERGAQMLRDGCESDGRCAVLLGKMLVKKVVSMDVLGWDQRDLQSFMNGKAFTEFPEGMVVLALFSLFLPDGTVDRSQRARAVQRFKEAHKKGNDKGTKWLARAVRDRWVKEPTGLEEEKRRRKDAKVSMGIEAGLFRLKGFFLG